ncbi:hypothetical protein AB1Y20_012343 [Prymnesium parvum]|uniref:HSF-type DNA-binding domain-containing protein n=1 Tax=Prymnesium parvum TaxID=97485 RepID=A0AB34IPF4_PRYPA
MWFPGNDAPWQQFHAAFLASLPPARGLPVAAAPRRPAPPQRAASDGASSCSDAGSSSRHSSAEPAAPVSWQWNIGKLGVGAGSVFGVGAAMSIAEELQRGGRAAPPFPTKLWAIVSEGGGESLAGWSHDGEAIRIRDPQRFAERTLPRYFKHNKWHTFQQQLLTYGFKRLPNASATDKSTTWQHPHFRQRQPELLVHVTRDPSRRSSADAQSTPHTPAAPFTAASPMDDSAQSVEMDTDGEEEEEEEEEVEEATPAMEALHEDVRRISRRLTSLREELSAARASELADLASVTQRVQALQREKPVRPSQAAPPPPPSAHSSADLVDELSLSELRIQEVRLEHSRSDMARK